MWQNLEVLKKVLIILFDVTGDALQLSFDFALAFNASGRSSNAVHAYRNKILAKLFTHCCRITKQYNLVVAVKATKVN